MLPIPGFESDAMAGPFRSLQRSLREMGFVELVEVVQAQVARGLPRPGEPLPARRRPPADARPPTPARPRRARPAKSVLG